MKNTLTFILLLAFSSSPAAGELIDRTLDVSASPDISIEDPNGRIEVHAWDKNTVKVSGELSAQALGYTFEKRGDNVDFEVDYESKTNWMEKNKAKDGSELKFYVPRKSRVEVSNINGAIDVIDVEGGTSVESINGDIVVKKLKQKINLETINGSISTNNIDGRVNIETINGNVKDKKSSGQLSISTVQGSITSTSRYTSIEIEIVNGDIDLNLDKIDELSIDSVNGNVNGSVILEFNKNVSADFRVDAFVGGTIVNKLSNATADKQKFGLGSSLHFSKNGGSARVSVNTVNGKIQLDSR
jgi:DUF4097 and DUF4098 domain-containing protein YvlB